MAGDTFQAKLTVQGLGCPRLCEWKAQRGDVYHIAGQSSWAMILCCRALGRFRASVRTPFLWRGEEIKSGSHVKHLSGYFVSFAATRLTVIEAEAGGSVSEMAINGTDINEDGKSLRR